MTRAEKANRLREIAQERILVKDGPYGTAIQGYRLDEAGFRAGRAFEHDQKGNNDLLNITRPDVVSAVCQAYADAGADLLATNTFNANAISQADYAYVLSGFMAEPIRWMARYGWRPLTEAEQQALFRFWDHVGALMGIEARPASLAALLALNAQVEAQLFRSAASNQQIGRAHV